MRKADSLIFDLDGTLWDTCASCAEAWNNVLREKGILFREITAEDLRRVVGKPHELCIRETFHGLPEDQILALIEGTIAEDNRVVACKGGIVFDGVAAGLEALSQKYPLFIVSNCQSGYIETFLKLTGFGALFKDFECWGNTGLSKGQNVQSVIRRNGLGSPVYIGDAEGDRAAARECGIPFVFVSYGFGQVKDFDLRVGSFSELTAAFL